MLIVGVSSAIARGLADFLDGVENRRRDIRTVGLASQFAALTICARAPVIAPARARASA
ncbi:MAG: hypothetical protein ABI611_23325 [Solirubrobacteraceae bacterium]